MIENCWAVNETFRSYEFELTIPQKSLPRIQVWDWDLASSNDKIDETSVDIENRWFSSHRATCGLLKRDDRSNLLTNSLSCWVRVTTPGETRRSPALFSMKCVAQRRSDGTGLSEGAARISAGIHPTEQRTRRTPRLGKANQWGMPSIDRCVFLDKKSSLVAKHIKCRSLFDPTYPDITPPKLVPYQLWLTIWNTSDVELNDENIITEEKASDICVKAWILGKKDDAQQNRYSLSVSLFLNRSLTVEDNFNSQFLFNFNHLEVEEKIVHEKKDSVFQVGNITKKLPPRIVIRVCDADLLLTDDFLGECVLDMTRLPIGEKSTKKCKAEILRNSKHRALNLFVHKRLAGKHSRHSVCRRMNDPEYVGGQWLRRWRAERFGTSLY